MGIILVRVVVALGSEKYVLESVGVDEVDGCLSTRLVTEIL